MGEVSNKEVVLALRSVEGTDEDVVWTAEQLHGISADEAWSILGGADGKIEEELEETRFPDEAVNECNESLRKEQRQVLLYRDMLSFLDDYPKDQSKPLLEKGYPRSELDEANVHVSKEIRLIKVITTVWNLIKLVIWCGVIFFIIGALEEGGVFFWGLLILAIVGIVKSFFTALLIPFSSVKEEALNNLIKEQEKLLGEEK